MSSWVMPVTYLVPINASDLNCTVLILFEITLFTEAQKVRPLLNDIEQIRPHRIQNMETEWCVTLMTIPDDLLCQNKHLSI